MTEGPLPQRVLDPDVIAAAYEAVRKRAEADPDILGLVLMGSRGYGGYIHASSDYDMLVIVADDITPWKLEHGAAVETWPMTIDAFRGHGLPGDRDEWNRPAFLGVTVLLDRLDGEIGRLVADKRTLQPEEARAIGADSLGAYINSLYRSLRNLEAGRELEGRLDALASIDPLLTASFAFEGRVRPFNKWLRHELAARPLAFVDVARVADQLASNQGPEMQRSVFRHVEVAAHLAGHGAVVGSWEPDVEWLRGGPFIVPETTVDDVVTFLDLMSGLGVRIWIDGGWAVDACLGEQTRRHGDLDIVIELHDLATVVAALTDLGYGHVPRDDTRPWNFVLGDDEGHEIDFHVIVRDETGSGAYGPPEVGDAYPSAALAGMGSIGGRDVACIAPEWLVRFHTGYEPGAKDVADVTALCRRFGIPLPAVFATTAPAEA
ncbi:MAG: hypothetical protein HY264_00235 [Chloroflexi bacterium]|nr:hypothetical protein [Chloroflexota bacterium]